MTEFSDLSPIDSDNTEISGFSLDGAIANMSTMEEVIQAILGMLGRSVETGGSDGPGYYVRWDNGIQLCWLRFNYSSPNIDTPSNAIYFTTPAPVKAFVAAFIAAPIGSIQFRCGKAVWPGSNGFMSSTQWPSVYPFAEIPGVATDLTGEYIAIGRWK